ncbi:MAG: aminoacetone oxidase family FAD-binding enzyme, partial [Nitrospira sp.]
MDEQVDIAIVGAGAAGLAAAIFAADAGAGQAGLRIVLLDGAKKIGAKILVSGGGRCNVTHEQVTPEDFSGTPHLVRNILAAFGVDATVRWFASLGVELKREDTGKLFPVTDRADTVLRALLDRCQTLGVEIRTNHRVLSIMSNAAPPNTPDFVIRHDQGECCARRVILATGGRSLPKTGSDGHGWVIAQTLGHTVTPTFPALVPLVLAPGMFHAGLAGVSQEVVLTTTVTGRQVDRRTGSLLWTHVGLSGPVVMDASRFWTKAKGEGDAVEMRSHFLPGMHAETVDRWMRDQGTERPRGSVAKLLAMRVPDRFATALCRFLGVEPSTSLGQLTREQRRRVAQGLTSLALPVERDRGWNYAEVTAGGVPLSEINFRTMESRKVPGLYLIGEMLDCDGRIG